MFFRQAIIHSIGSEWDSGLNVTSEEKYGQTESSKVIAFERDAASKSTPILARNGLSGFT